MITTIYSKQRNEDGQFISDGIIEDNYSEDWLPETHRRDPKFNHRERGQNGPVVVYISREAQHESD